MTSAPALRAQSQNSSMPTSFGSKVAAGVADERHAELAHEVEHVAAEALLVRLRVAGLVDSGVDGATEVLDEGTEEFVGNGADGGLREKREGCVHFGTSAVFSAARR